MRLEGRGINLQAGTECICLLLFGYLIFHLTYSGEYLNYVTPRMKPYLYGLSVLMVIWAAAEGRYLLAPQYKAKLARSFVLILPALMLSVHLPAPGESSMAKSYDNAGTFMAAGNGGRVNGEKKLRHHCRTLQLRRRKKTRRPPQTGRRKKKSGTGPERTGC